MTTLYTDTVEPETVWEQTRFDSGLYLCRVTRGDDSNGKLTITLVGTINHLLHQETVKADRIDADKWRSICVTVINNPDLRSMS